VATFAGVAIALSLPPFGWWPLAIVGLAVFAVVVHRRPLRRRVLLGAALGLGQYAIGLWWVSEFNAAGYVALVVLTMLFTAAAGAAITSRGWVGVLIGLPAALTVADWVRGHFPFGGLPLGGIPLGQAAGPLVPVTRLGGPLLVTGVTAALGAVMAVFAAAGAAGAGRRIGRPASDSAGVTHRPLPRPAGADATDAPLPRPAGADTTDGGTSRPAPVDTTGGGPPAAAAGAIERTRLLAGAATGRTRLPPAGRREVVAAAVVLAVVGALVAAGRLSPDGGGGGATRVISVAAVQGGGPRGLHASEVDPDVAFQRQLSVTTAIQKPVDLVVWPEDVVVVDRPIGQTPESTAVGQLAVRLHATVVAGVVENVGADRFRNAAVVWSPAGVIVARYDKVHRVPFGEYIPGRALFRHLANLDLVPRDAIAGRGPGLLDTPAGPLGTVISYEVFFEDRARAAIHAGGELLVVPTNASSYRTSQVPTQEVAAAQLRAWETGRDTIQAAPTGFSALIDHDGRILARSTLGRPQVLTGRLTLRNGRTLFVRLGELPVVVVAILGLIAPLGRARRPR
jgi:apolipoprotein N-acyltransferase